MKNSDILKTNPVVFAVSCDYHIMVPVSCDTVMWVKIGDEIFCDDFNGILRSNTNVHHVIVPMKKLDKERKYTICLRKVIDRKPYFPQTSDVYEFYFEFKPVPEKNVRAFNISDAHNLSDEPIKACENYIKEFGDIDFLILNGDVPNDGSSIENFETIYLIASKIAKGNIPVIYVKGNHENRGYCAEELENYIPNFNNKSYYTFTLSNVWGLIIDCGEDKLDCHDEYGDTVNFSLFRKKETEYIESVIKNAKNEYEKEGIKHKIVLSHIPFTRKHKEPFDIEEDTYMNWAKIIKENIKPDIMLSGHEHKALVVMPGGDDDVLGHPSPVLIGSIPRICNVDVKSFVGAGIEFLDDTIKVKFSSSIDEENITDFKDTIEIKL